MDTMCCTKPTMPQATHMTPVTDKVRTHTLPPLLPKLAVDATRPATHSPTPMHNAPTRLAHNQGASLCTRPGAYSDEALPPLVLLLLSPLLLLASPPRLAS